ncbi:acetate--CoA ligase [Polyangium sorediatum]|uniref:Acetate--CoA ligase n=1 Tax=Polyangium sorediatum TaxID=889274 RepID=A0ABT6NNW4_9BACT|nr:acetate--CoA ligase [Polyangium sorediatum]MDI1430012.1 acetate--CoA ligase [Polyangium sorediatum]
MKFADEPLAYHPKVRSMEDYETLYRQSLEEPEVFWSERARALSWFYPPHSTMDVDPESADVAWYSGGRLNACFNAVDRHAAHRPNKIALVWAKNEPGAYERISFRKLKHEVCRLANVLKSFGVRKGDRVCLYMPMIPELVYAMLACARIGAVHSVVFAGFSAESLRERILDAGCEVVLTANEALRGAKRIPLKHIVDDAVEGLSLVHTVLVARRTDVQVPMHAGRDHFLDEVMDKHRSTCPVEWMAAEDPLFILYTSGSTGKPKGVLHTTGGYLVYAALTHAVVFDLRPDDVHFCTADLGWITGHSYVVYGPLVNGTTTVLLETLPNYPDASRIWEVVDDVKATQLYTAPTALRSLMAAGDAYLETSSRDTLRVLASAGEPINPEAWRWYHDQVGKGRAAVVDTFWQTETGGVLVTPLPFVTPAKPGSATKPFFGVELAILDDQGHILDQNGVSGNLCVKRSWPGQARTLYGDHRRFRETYYARFPGLYFTGDGCLRDEDGDIWVTGRVDDVLNVSGHRLGTAEVESALSEHDAIAEAAVVGIPHAIKGTGIFAYVVLRPGVSYRSEIELQGALKEQVRHAIGPIATPDGFRIVSALPKTRSGKIMRRILRKIACGETENLGDTTTLADPTLMDELLEKPAEGAAKSRTLGAEVRA